MGLAMSLSYRWRCKHARTSAGLASGVPPPTGVGTMSGRRGHAVCAVCAVLAVLASTAARITSSMVAATRWAVAMVFAARMQVEVVVALAAKMVVREGWGVSRGGGRVSKCGSLDIFFVPNS